jgi:hypothetical protein
VTPVWQARALDRSPCTGLARPQAQLGWQGRKEYRWGKTFPLGKVGGGEAHRSGATPWRRWFDRARERFLGVEARGHRRRVPMIPADGEGDMGGELHATTEGRRESAHGGGYHRSSEERW